MTPVRPVRLYVQVVEQVMDLLSGGSLVLGDRLPSERELSSRFQVSRASLRQALTAIEVSGYIETRPGSGTYVTAIPESQVQGSTSAFGTISNSVAPLEILEARALFEPGVARLAAIRRSEDDIAAMQALIDRMAADLKIGRDGWEADWGFHQAMGAATQNASVQALAKGFQEQMEQPVWSLMRARNLGRVGRAHAYNADHERVLQAIKHGDADLAQRMMAEHIDHVISDLDDEE